MDTTKEDRNRLDALKSQADFLDIDVFISNDRFAVRFLILSFGLTLFFGVAMMVVAQQEWLQIDQAVARPTVTLAGACMTALGSFPLMRILDRLEKIRVLKRIKEQRDVTIARAEIDLEKMEFLENMVRQLYEKRALG